MDRPKLDRPSKRRYAADLTDDLIQPFARKSALIYRVITVGQMLFLGNGIFGGALDDETPGSVCECGNVLRDFNFSRIRPVEGASGLTFERAALFDLIAD
jgi:hypothetical protein